MRSEIDIEGCIGLSARKLQTADWPDLAPQYRALLVIDPMNRKTCLDVSIEMQVNSIGLPFIRLVVLPYIGISDAVVPSTPTQL